MIVTVADGVAKSVANCVAKSVANSVAKSVTNCVANCEANYVANCVARSQSEYPELSRIVKRPGKHLCIVLCIEKNNVRLL